MYKNSSIVITFLRYQHLTHKIIKQNVYRKLWLISISLNQFFIFNIFSKFKYIKLSDIIFTLYAASAAYVLFNMLCMYDFGIALMQNWQDSRQHFVPHERIVWYWKYRVEQKIDSLNAPWISHAPALAIVHDRSQSILKRACGKY